MIDLERIRSFLDGPTCARIVAELHAASGAAAAVYGVPDAQGVRQTTRVTPSHETVSLIHDALHARVEQVARRFEAPVHEVEELQFLRYDVGDFFVAHQDGNTPVMNDARSLARRVSAVIFLNDDYRGGELVFHDGMSRTPVAAEPGTLLLFRSETTHEVRPVEAGVRFSIATWFRSSSS